MAADYAREVQSAQPHGPYLLLGHSFGATVAFELAARFEASGETVASLFVLDASSPGTAAPAPIPEDELGLLIYATRTLAIFFATDLPLDPGELAPLDRQARLSLVLSRL